LRLKIFPPPSNPRLSSLSPQNVNIFPYIFLFFLFLNKKNIMYSYEIIRKFIELKAKNIPNDKISEELKVSVRTLTDWGRKYLKEILIQKQIELDELKNSLNIAEDQQLEFYSKIIDKCKTAFINSDFEKIDCSNLFKLYNLAVSQVRKCRFVDMRELALTEEKERPAPLFNSPMFNNIR
jgi:hypothetical protein